MALLGLFTQYQIFWVIGLLVAMMDLPDLLTPVNRIAGSTEKIAGLKPGEGIVAMPSDIGPGIEHADEPVEASETKDRGRRGQRTTRALAQPELHPH